MPTPMRVVLSLPEDFESEVVDIIKDGERIRAIVLEPSFFHARENKPVCYFRAELDGKVIGRASMQLSGATGQFKLFGRKAVAPLIAQQIKDAK